ncbi:hypothetical protein EI94DRAFT_1207142 [Lactarius quietus]|nr:hypothetical protein EI94DRAFT_1207142 [Lactarius quietus]
MRQHQHLYASTSLTPSFDLLPEGYDPRYDTRYECKGREKSCSTLNERIRTSPSYDGGCAQNSNRIQSQVTRSIFVTARFENTLEQPISHPSEQNHKHIQLYRSALLVPSPLLVVKPTRPVMRSPSISWTIPPRHTILATYSSMLIYSRVPIPPIPHDVRPSTL